MTATASKTAQGAKSEAGKADAERRVAEQTSKPERKKGARLTPEQKIEKLERELREARQAKAERASKQVTALRTELQQANDRLAKAQAKVDKVKAELQQAETDAAAEAVES